MAKNYSNESTSNKSGSLTAEQKKNTCRPHKACIFLSNFIHLVVAIYGYI